MRIVGPRGWASTPAAAALVVLLVVGVFAVFVLTPDDEPQVAASTGDPTTSSASPSTDATSTDVASPPSPTATASTGRPSASATSKEPSLPDPTTVCVPQERTIELKVVSYNIHSARPFDGGRRLARIGDELAALDADVILLQEVDRGRAWTSGVDMPAVLAKRLGMGSVFGSNVQRAANNQYGTAILSRFEVVDSGNDHLPKPRGTQQRGLLRVVLDVEGTEVSFYNTHLEPGASGARLAQMRMVMRTVNADTRPKFLGGDLNSSPNTPTLGATRSGLRDTWAAVGSGAGLTAPSGNPRLRIDYLLYNSGGNVTVSPTGVSVGASRTSDHRPVIANYRLVVDDGDVCVPVFPEQDRRGKAGRGRR